MAYDFYIGKMLFPIPPETINIQINGRNETVVLINDGEINMLKAAGLTSGSFTLLLPNTPYPFARYTGGFQNAKVYLDYLESLKKESKVVQWIISRRFPSGKTIYDTNIQVALEDYTIRDDRKNAGFDTLVDVHLKQYKGYGTKTFSVDLSEANAPIVVPTERQPSTVQETPPSNNNPTPPAKLNDYKVQIPGMSVVQTKAKNEAEAIEKTVPDYWKGTVYVNGVSYDAGTKKPAQPKTNTTTTKTETPKTTQEVAEKAENNTGKTQTKPIVDKGTSGNTAGKARNGKFQIVCLQ